MSSLVSASEYFKIESRKTVYAVQPGCCFESVCYDPHSYGINSKNDESGDYLNSYLFLCGCHPNENIEPICEEEYNKKRDEVCNALRDRW